MHALIILNIEWEQFVFQNCEILLSEVWIIKTAPHSTLTPQMWCVKGRMPPDFLARFCKANLSNAKNLAWFVFQEFVSGGLNFCDQEPSWLLNVIEDDCYFLGVHIRLSTRCKIWFTLGLSANYFFLKWLSLSLKFTWMCSKVYWFLEYKFIVWFKLQIY